MSTVLPDFSEALADAVESAAVDWSGLKGAIDCQQPASFGMRTASS